MTVRQVVDAIRKEKQAHQAAVRRLVKLENSILQAARLEREPDPTNPGGVLCVMRENVEEERRAA